MNQNVSIPAGGLLFILYVEKSFGLFSYLFKDIAPKARDFIPSVKLLCFNKLTHTVSIHRIHIEFKKGNVEEFVLNGRHYWCLKYKKEEDRFLYIYFCKELLKDQIRKKMRAFENAKKRGDKILRRRRPERIPCSKGWIELVPHIQETIL